MRWKDGRRSANVDDRRRVRLSGKAKGGGLGIIILALVGMSGGGKTSLVNLIPRFYDVSEGTISIDDVDIRKIGLVSLRQQMAVVTQEPILFNDTVRNNIRYSCPDASDKEVTKAARQLGGGDWLEGLPSGLDTNAGERGSQLSMGQRQLVAMARVVLLYSSNA